MKKFVLLILLIGGFTACQEQQLDVDMSPVVPNRLRHEESLGEQCDPILNALSEIFLSDKELLMQIEHHLEETVGTDYEDALSLVDVFAFHLTVDGVPLREKLIDVLAHQGYSTSEIDRMLEYLQQSNFEMYRPYPLQDYVSKVEDIERVALLYPIDELTCQGYQLDFAKKNIVSVNKIDESYADTIPVYILKPRHPLEPLDSIIGTIDGAIYPEPHGNNTGNDNDDEHSEVMLTGIYCTNFCGVGWGKGAIRLQVCRLATNDCSYNAATHSYTGAWRMSEIVLPRKYIKHARKQWNSGWYKEGLAQLWDADWHKHKTMNLMYIFRQGTGDVYKTTTDLNTYDENGKLIGTCGQLSYETRDDNYVLGMQEWPRYWFFDIYNNGHPDWYYEHSSGIRNYKWNDSYIYKFGNSLLLTFRVRPF